MDDDNTNRSTGLRVGNDSSSDLPNPIVLSIKITVVLLSVAILSVGLVGCSIFFIYLCFMYPETAKSFVPGMISCTIAAVLAHFGTKVSSALSDKLEKISKKESD